jgi:hypothetical protein
MNRNPKWFKNVHPIHRSAEAGAGVLQGLPARCRAAPAALHCAGLRPEIQHARRLARRAD